MKTFADILHKYFGLPEGIHIWKPFPKLDPRRYGKPQDYGEERWEDVEWNGDTPKIIEDYWNCPLTKEGDEAWQKFLALIDDMEEAGFLTADQKGDITCHACDTSYDLD